MAFRAEYIVIVDLGCFDSGSTFEYVAVADGQLLFVFVDDEGAFRDDVVVSNHDVAFLGNDIHARTNDGVLADVDGSAFHCARSKMLPNRWVLLLDVHVAMHIVFATTARRSSFHVGCIFASTCFVS